MPALEPASNRTAAPDLAQARQAKDAARALAAIPPADGHQAVRVQGQTESVAVPESAFRLFLEILNQMGQGNAVTLVPMHHELTTQQAADLMGVSRPYFVKLLETNAIPFHCVGSRRRVKFAHLQAYLESVRGQSREALDRLAAEAQSLRLGY